MRAQLTTILICSCLVTASCGVDDQNTADPGGIVSTEQPLCNTKGNGVCGPVPRPKPLPNPYPCSSNYWVTSPGGVTMFLDPTGNYNISAHEMTAASGAARCSCGQAWSRTSAAA